MSRWIACRFRDDESGFAMVAAVTLSSMLMVLTVSMLGSGLHLQQATVRDVSWNTAMTLAEAGVDRAVYEVTKDATYAGTGTGVLTFADPAGEVQLLVQNTSLGSMTVWSTAWVPSRTAVGAATRRIKVTYGPEDVFKYALFSTSGLAVKSNAVVHGSLFANESVLLESNSVVFGDVTSAKGTVKLDSNAKSRVQNGLGGSVRSGGFDTTGFWGVQMANGAIAEKDVLALAETCPGTSADDTRYNIDGATIGGNATARGTVSGSVAGTKTPRSCQLREPTRPLPAFTWDPSQYASPNEWTTVAALQTWVSTNKSSLTGVHHLVDPSCAGTGASTSTALDLGGGFITSDFTLVSNCRLIMDPHDLTITAPDSAYVTIVVQNASTTPPAILIKNNLAITNNPAVLLYAQGTIEIKNNGDGNGAVYAGAISIKNNLGITYDPRVERTIGFGSVKYARQAWIECKRATTGTAC